MTITVDFNKKLTEFDHLHRPNCEQFSFLINEVIEKKNKHFEVFRIDSEKDYDGRIYALSLKFVPVYANTVNADMTLNEIAFAIATDEANVWLSMRGCRPIPQGLTTREEVCDAVRLSIANTVKPDNKIVDEIKAVTQEFLASVDVYQYLIAREVEIFYALLNISNEDVVDTYDKMVLEYICGQQVDIVNKTVV